MIKLDLFYVFTLQDLHAYTHTKKKRNILKRINDSTSFQHLIFYIGKNKILLIYRAIT